MSKNKKCHRTMGDKKKSHNPPDRHCYIPEHAQLAVVLDDYLDRQTGSRTRKNLRYFHRNEPRSNSHKRGPVNRDLIITSSQPQVIRKEYQKRGLGTTEQRKVLDSVLLMTPENLHINALYVRADNRFGG